MPTIPLLRSTALLALTVLVFVSGCVSHTVPATAPALCPAGTARGELQFDVHGFDTPPPCVPVQ